MNFANLDLETALTACTASADVYSAWTIEYARTATRVVIKPQGPWTVVAFQGTRDLQGALADVHCRRVYAGAYLGIHAIGNDEMVHSGFAEGVVQTYLQILRAIPADGRPLLLTGHSKGGAEAELFARMLYENSIPFLLVTFGAPRAGNAAWSAACQEKFGAKSYGFVCELDAVPRMPGYLVGWRHFGHRIYLEEGGPMIDPPPCVLFLEDLYAIWTHHGISLRNWALGLLAEPLRDHHIKDHYLAHLAALKNL
jgi:hypothetical protein